MLFEYYDTSNDGRINYKEFSTMLAGPPAENPAKLAAAYNQPKYNKKEEVKPERNGPADDIDSLIKLFRSKIMGRGARGIVGIQRIFKIMDDDNSRTLSLAEFTKAVKDFKVGVSEENCPVLFDAFDLNRDGTLNIDEFLMAIRGEMNQKRVAQVEKAFRKIDKDGKIKGSWTVSNDEKQKGDFELRPTQAIWNGQFTEGKRKNSFSFVFAFVDGAAYGHGVDAAGAFSVSGS